MTSNIVPTNFKPHTRKSPLTDPWEPLYAHHTEEAVIIGLHANEHHCNARGMVHGGLISALADNAMGLSCGVAYTRAGHSVSGLVTVTLHVDFLRPAAIGQWLAFETTATKTGARMATAQGRVTADGRDCAFISATFSNIGATSTGQPA